MPGVVHVHYGLAMTGSLLSSAQCVQSRGSRRPLTRGDKQASLDSAVRRAAHAPEQRRDHFEEWLESPDRLACIAAEEAKLLQSLDRLDGLLWRKHPL